MKEYTLLERVLMVLKVIVSIVSWVSRILFKIARDMVRGGKKSSAATSTTNRANTGSSSLK